MALRVIQIGVGGFGGGWLGRLVSSDLVEVVGIVDTNPDILAKQQTQHEIGVAGTSLAEVLDRVEADAAVVVTPPEFHGPVADQAFEAGLHVLTEKPLADSAEHALAMVEHAEKKGVTLMVSQNYRFRAIPRTIARMVAEKTWGDVDSVTVRFFKGPKFEGSFRRKMRYPLILDMCIHHFDLMRALLGRDARRVYARSWLPSWSWYEGEPTLAGVYDFEGGAVATYSGSWCSLGGETSWDGEWRIECSKGVIEWRADGLYASNVPDSWEKIEPDPCPVQSQDYSLAEFVRAIAEGREPECSGRDNLNSIDMVFKTVESVEKGMPVEL